MRAALSDWSRARRLTARPRRASARSTAPGGLDAWLGVMLLRRNTLRPRSTPRRRHLRHLPRRHGHRLPRREPARGLRRGPSRVARARRASTRTSPPAPRAATCSSGCARGASIPWSACRPRSRSPPAPRSPRGASCRGRRACRPRRAARRGRRGLAIVLIIGGILAASMSAGGRPLWDVDARRQDTEHEVFVAAQQLVEPAARLLRRVRPVREGRARDRRAAARAARLRGRAPARAGLREDTTLRLVGGSGGGPATA